MSGAAPAKAGPAGAWPALALSAVFVSLGLLFLAAPRHGAALFGLPAPEGPSFGYVPAIGLRDLAFGLYLFALAGSAPPRALARVLAITVLIPIGDVVLVALERGLESPAHLLLHAGSGLALAAAAAWMARLSPRTARETSP